MKARIEITKGPDRGRQFMLEANETRLIGRGDHVHIKMVDELVSREHCEVHFDGNQLTIRDLGSTNKTFVHQQKIQPIPPNQKISIQNGQNFFVGPESCFAVSVESTADPTAPPNTYPQNTQPASPAGNSNFSRSLVSPPSPGSGLGGPFSGDSSFGGDSSYQNLTGPVSPSPGLDQLNQRPINQAGSPPPMTPPSQPLSERTERGPATAGYPGGYEGGSIVPPGMQGLDGPARREQVTDQEYVNEEHLKSTPSVDPEDAIVQQPPQTVDNAAQTPKSSPPASPFAASIAAPGQPLSPTAPMRTRPKSDTKPIGEAQPQTPSPDDSHFHRSPLAESIAAPGQVYAPEPQPAPVNQSPPPVAEPSTKIPGSVADPVANQQPNGLFFHTGKNVDSIDSTFAQLTEQWQAIVCIDFSKVTVKPNPSATTNSQSPLAIDESTPDDSKGSSPFDLDDEEADSPFADSVQPPPASGEPENAPATPSEEPPTIVGEPLYTFLPEALRHNGPVLQTKEQLTSDLKSMWLQDSAIVFLGTDAAAMIDHLKALLNTNLQTGKPSQAMFGYCWPAVLHTILESQPTAAVNRVFGDCISGILLEDPMDRFAWNLIAQRDLTTEFPWLAKEK